MYESTLASAFLPDHDRAAEIDRIVMMSEKDIKDLIEDQEKREKEAYRRYVDAPRLISAEEKFVRATGHGSFVSSLGDRSDQAQWHYERDRLRDLKCIAGLAGGAGWHSIGSNVYQYGQHSIEIETHGVDISAAPHPRAAIAMIRYAIGIAA
jgi:hypothetical protein